MDNLDFCPKIPYTIKVYKVIPYSMKNILQTIKNKVSGSATTDRAVVNDAPATISEQEINRRIDMAAKHTVKEYGHIIERLSKE